MREIIHLQVGQCGNQIGSQFWHDISVEHGIGLDGIYVGDSQMQLQQISVCYSEGIGGRYVPRSIFADLDSGTIDGVRSGLLRDMFRPDNLISGSSGTGNNWARGFYADGAGLDDKVLEAVRKEAEACDCLQGFQLTHSLGGGSGSGMGTLLLTKIREEYPDTILSSFSVFPSPKVSNTVVEPYNTVLSLSRMTDCTDMTFCIDNEALFGICSRTLKVESHTCYDLNRLIAEAMSGITTCVRFPGLPSGDLRKLALNVVPFRRLHFLMPGIAPVMSRSCGHCRECSVSDVACQMFDASNMLVSCNPHCGRYMTAEAIFLGDLSTREAEEQVAVIRKNSGDFVEWIPDSVKTVVCHSVSPHDIGGGCSISAVVVGNNTAVQALLCRAESQFSAMLKRKAFAHWYISEGMDLDEFDDASRCMTDLVSEYQRCEDPEQDVDSSFAEDKSKSDAAEDASFRGN